MSSDLRRRVIGLLFLCLDESPDPGGDVEALTHQMLDATVQLSDEASVQEIAMAGKMAQAAERSTRDMMREFCRAFAFLAERHDAQDPRTARAILEELAQEAAHEDDSE